ncbi:MAG TPA: YbfB/YjiJ family MFS transporter [Salinisphaeraceae bacterium]|nr:YbfB/YjiJ family MFS transporter [Salinisphaeraceae bacterium]
MPAPARTDSAPTPFVVAMAGLVALAVAMGIGRFAFTPIMPMMEADAGLTLRAAGWLAAVNYLGYFLGALCAVRVPLHWAIRGGLLLIATVTFAMGETHVFALQLVLRLLAGIASAWVLVHVSAWALHWLLAWRRSQASGIVYAGVGVGIAVAGLLSMAAMLAQLHSDRAWQLLGLLSLFATLLLWRAFRVDDSTTGKQAAEDTGVPARIRWDADKWRLLICYGVFGIGYIIPATYLPDMAHRYIDNPLVFGLAWPVFGLAAALSTWLASRWMTRVDGRRLWALCYVLMATGVALPAFWTSLVAIMLAALLVGGTFMVVTMLGLREARLAVGAEATAFIALMTAAFAIGQILGPLLVSAVLHWAYGFAGALLGVAAALLLAGVSLWRSAAMAA